MKAGISELQHHNRGEADRKRQGAALEARPGLLDGFVIWGDVTYRKGMFFSPDYCRKYSQPTVKSISEPRHQHNLPMAPD